MSDDEYEGDAWETVVNVRKINRHVRRERKAAEAAAAGSSIGEVVPEFDAAERKKLAAASFYGKPGKNGKKKKHRELPSVEDEDAGWVGGSGSGGDGALLDGRKKKRSKNKEAQATLISTREEMVAAIMRIMETAHIANRSSSQTMSAIGDKLQTLTKQAWNKKFKSQFGSLPSFLASQPEFKVAGNEVSLSGKSSSATPVKPKSTSNTSTKHTPSTKQHQHDSDDESEDESEDEDEDASDSQPAQNKSRSVKKQKQQQRSVRKQTSKWKVLTILFVIGAAAVAFILSKQRS